MKDEVTKALIQIKAHKEELTRQQIKTLKGQVLAGDTVGAIKGLEKILRRGSQ